MPYMSGTFGVIGVSTWCLHFMIDELLLNASFGGYMKIMDIL